MTRGEIEIATYQDTITLVEAVAQTYGPLPQTACRSIVRELRERIDATLDRECHRKAAEALAS
jgi:hypothetical protein